RLRAQVRLEGSAVAAGGQRVLVYVVAEVDDQVQILLGDVVVGGVVAVVPGLAGGEHETQSARVAAPGGRGAGAARGRERRSGPEAVVVPAVRLQAPDLRVHAVGQLPGRGRLAATHHPGEGLVLGHLELDRHRVRSGAAV